MKIEFTHNIYVVMIRKTKFSICVRKMKRSILVVQQSTIFILKLIGLNRKNGQKKKQQHIDQY